MPRGIYIRTKLVWNKGIKIDRKKYPKMGHFVEHSLRTKRKISKALEGRIAWNKGKKMTYKNGMLGKKNPYLVKRNKSKKQRQIVSKAMSNRIISKETRKKMSEAHKGEHPRSYFQKMGLVGGAMSALKQSKTKQPTSIEKKVYEELKSRGLLFEKQKLIKGKFVVDAWIPSLNLIIEADGNYWHSLPKAIKRDKSKDAYLTKCGYNLLRLSETEINNGSFKNKLPNGLE